MAATSVIEKLEKDLAVLQGREASLRNQLNVIQQQVEDHLREGRPDKARELSKEVEVLIGQIQTLVGDVLAGNVELHDAIAKAAWAEHKEYAAEDLARLTEERDRISKQILEIKRRRRQAMDRYSAARGVRAVYRQRLAEFRDAIARQYSKDLDNLMEMDSRTRTHRRRK